MHAPTNTTTVILFSASPHQTVHKVFPQTTFLSRFSIRFMISIRWLSFLIISYSIIAVQFILTEQFIRTPLFPLKLAFPFPFHIPEQFIIDNIPNFLKDPV